MSTSIPTHFNRETTGEEVAKLYASEIKGKNGELELTLTRPPGWPVRSRHLADVLPI